MCLQASSSSSETLPPTNGIADKATEWASGDPSAPVQWEVAASDGVLSHKFYRQNQTLFSESNQQADWGSWYWATADTDGVSTSTAFSLSLFLPLFIWIC